MIVKCFDCGKEITIDDVRTSKGSIKIKRRLTLDDFRQNKNTFLGGNFTRGNYRIDLFKCECGKELFAFMGDRGKGYGVQLLFKIDQLSDKTKKEIKEFDKDKPKQYTKDVSEIIDEFQKLDIENYNELVSFKSQYLDDSTRMKKAELQQFVKDEITDIKDRL